MAYTTASLVSAVERRAFIPTGQTTFTTEEILAIADEQLRLELVPTIMSVREEYFVNHKDYSVTASQQAYDIPARSVGLIVREIHYVNPSGQVTDLDRIEPENIDSTSRQSSIPESFFVKNNQIWLHPVPSSTQGSLRVYFHLRPSDHIETTSAAVVASIASNVVTVTDIPSSWATGDIFDFVRQDGGQEVIGFDETSTLVSGSDITFASVPSTLRVGDYISPQGQTPLVNLIPEFRDLLAQATASFMLEKMKLPDADSERANFEKARDNVRNMLSPRTQGSPRTVPLPDYV